MKDKGDSKPPESEQPDPSTWSQEQLMNFMEHVLSEHRRAHKPGTRERDGYEAALGLIMQHDKRRGWWTRFKWGWWKRIHERRLTRKLQAQRAGREGSGER